jgi:ATP-dependent Clp protease ATP-binding subunit ClpC
MSDGPWHFFAAFGEQARRALFFARYSLTEIGGAAIEDRHLLLGVLMASPDAIGRFVDPAHWTALRVEIRLQGLSPWEPSLSTGVEVPFSPETQRALRAAGERPRPHGREIVPEHLVWAVMADPATPVAALLAEAGVTRAAIEAFLDRP